MVKYKQIFQIMTILIASFIVSTLVILGILRWEHLHQHLSADYELTGVQKFHRVPVSRIGGVGVFAGLLIAVLIRSVQNFEAVTVALMLILASLPAFLTGLLEDITKKIRAAARLLAAAISAALAGYFLEAWVVDLGIPGATNMLSSQPLLSVFITCFAVAGLTNSFNIIDGYNGLSSMVAIIILMGISYVAFQVNDVEILLAAIAMIGAILGFVIWNYPRGLIFLGDGGAYLIGFWVAELALLLTLRHQQISPWFAVLVCFYPIYETLFTIYRRAFIKKTKIGMPDALHLHQILFRRVVRWAVGSQLAKDLVSRNSLTAPYLWAAAMVTVIPAMLFWGSTWALMFFILMFAISYTYIYSCVVRFKTPKWIVLKKNGAS